MSLEDRLYPLLRLYEAAPQPLKTLAGRAYRALPSSWRQGKAFAQFSQEAIESEHWDEDTRIRYQTAAVKASLLAANRSPFYARRFAECGVRPEQFESLEQLADYPFLTKQDLLEHREAMVDPASSSSQRLYLTTGGSSGVPVGFYLQKGVSRPKEQAYLEAQWRRRGYHPGEPTAVIRGAVTSRRAAGGISYHDATRNWLILSSYHLTPQRLPEYLAVLNRFKPRHLHAYPSAALLLARAMQEIGARLEFPLTSILCGSEKLSAESQQLLEQHFQAPVFHWYGHSERVVLAAQAAQSNHLYFWPGYGYVEFGPPDETGACEVIGTSFHNQVMPLIRYRTGDCVFLPKQTEVEAALPMTEVMAVVGRDYEFLISATGRRISLTAINMHDRVFDGLLAVQFVQQQAGEVRLRLQPGPRWHPKQLETIRQSLLVKLGDDFTLHLEPVTEVEKTAAGKHRWLITSLK
jgi:phenylacetate-CoA ligase